ncbi:hypothetical protein [Dolichospermum phage Dfl-JY45]
MKKIDLNDPKDFTRESVAELLASVEDTQNWQLRVTKAGIAYLSEVVGGQDTTSLAFRLETWCANNGYVGAVAAKDEQWVDQVFKDLYDNWPNPTRELIDF